MMLEDKQAGAPAQPAAEDAGPGPDVPSSRKRLLRLSGVFLVLLAITLGVFGVVAYAGWRSGESLRAERIQTESARELDRQLELAREDVDAGRYLLAIRRLDWVLARDADNGDAELLRGEAQAALDALLTPSPTPIPPTPTPLPPTATPVPTIAPDPADAFADVEGLVKTESWEAAIPALLDFQVHFPAYRRDVTNEMLYDAYIQHGLALLETDQVELGLYYLSRAEELGDLPEEALEMRSHAELYLQGIVFYGVDWDLAIAYFRDLCLVAPFFHDACGRLYGALVGYGDQFAAMGEWCPAVNYYRQARQYDSDDFLQGKINQATQGCLSATPTPLPTPEGGITDTLPITGTVPITGTTPIP